MTILKNRLSPRPCVHQSSSFCWTRRCCLLRRSSRRPRRKRAMRDQGPWEKGFWSDGDYPKSQRARHSFSFVCLSRRARCQCRCAGLRACQSRICQVRVVVMIPPCCSSFLSFAFSMMKKKKVKVVKVMNANQTPTLSLSTLRAQDPLSRRVSSFTD